MYKTVPSIRHRGCLKFWLLSYTWQISVGFTVTGFVQLQHLHSVVHSIIQNNTKTKSKVKIPVRVHLQIFVLQPAKQKHLFFDFYYNM